MSELRTSDRAGPYHKLMAIVTALSGLFWALLCRMFGRGHTRGHTVPVVGYLPPSVMDIPPDEREVLVGQRVNCKHCGKVVGCGAELPSTNRVMTCGDQHMGLGHIHVVCEQTGGPSTWKPDVYCGPDDKLMLLCKTCGNLPCDAAGLLQDIDGEWRTVVVCEW